MKVSDAAQQRNAVARKPVEIEYALAVFPAEQRVGFEPLARIVQLIHRPFGKSAFDHPEGGVFPAIPTREAQDAADAEVNFAPALVQLFGNLRARLAAADDEHGAGGKALRALKFARM